MTRQFKDTIRQLRPGEAVPQHPPRRYSTGSGYIRLRWKVGVAQYVETYEHRVFDGAVTTAEHVHHKNKDRSDNRPENLVQMTAEEHTSHHSHERRTWAPFNTFGAMWKAAHAENRRFDRDRRTQRMRELYAQGLSTIEIGRRFGLHPSGVWRYINLGVNP